MGTTKTPAKVQEIADILRNTMRYDDSAPRWDTVEVDQYQPDFWIIRAERDADHAILRTNMAVYVGTLRSARGNLLGGYWESFGNHWDIKTWRDVKVHAAI